MKLVAEALAGLGAFIASVATIGCFLIIIDEPEMPESLIK